MKKILLTTLLAIGILIVFGVVSANAQSDELKGRYTHEGKKNETFYSFTLNFQSKGAVFYSYDYNGYGTLKGNWSVEKDIVTVVIPKEDSTLMFKFIRENDDLIVTETLQHMESVIDAGTVFKKIVNKPTRPDLSSEDISNRIIKLIESLKNSDHISPENIKHVMKIKVDFNKDNRREYGFGGNITNTSWRYNLSAYLLPTGNGKKPDTLLFTFDNPAENADMKPICSIDFDKYRRDLKKAGFSAEPYYGEHGGLLWWNFSRDGIFVQISPNGESDKFTDHLCVKTLIVNVGEK